MNKTRKASIYFWSIVNLRPSMLYWRAHREVKGLIIAQLEKTKFAPRLFHPPAQAPEYRILPLPASRQRAERIELRSRIFTFLNDTEKLPDDKGRRLGAVESRPLLWRFHYGYHDYLQELLESGKASPEEIADFIEEWSADYPLSARGARTWAWHPYVLSLRIDSWIRVCALFNDAFAKSGMERNSRCCAVAAGIEQMTLVLVRNLEFGTMANHLLKNIKALLLAGLFLGNRTGERAFKRGLSLLRRELREQILTDGMHFERSPMYHTAMTSDMLDLVEAFGAAGKTPPDCLSDAASRMAVMLENMLHPDGSIPVFNDSVERFGLEPSETAARRERQANDAGIIEGARDSAWTASDLRRVSGLLTHRRPELFVVFDGGMVGPDYQPGHAHCDTLAFEASLRGRRFITDTGVFHYRESPERAYSRSTAAHNTVRIDAEDQSEVWKSFRVGRRASALLCERRTEKGAVIFHAAHDGFARLEREMFHERFMVIGDESWICVVDMLHGEGRHLVENILHFHSSVSLRREAGGFAASSPAGQAFVKSITGENAKVFETDYYPAFGVRQARKTIVFNAHRSFPCLSAYQIEFKRPGPELIADPGARSAVLRLPDGAEILLKSKL